MPFSVQRSAEMLWTAHRISQAAFGLPSAADWTHRTCDCSHVRCGGFERVPLQPPSTATPLPTRRLMREHVSVHETDSVFAVCRGHLFCRETGQFHGLVNKSRPYEKTWHLAPAKLHGTSLHGPPPS